MKEVLVTGSAGFIGFHLARRLLGEGISVTGVDALTPAYDSDLKTARLAHLAKDSGYTHIAARIETPGFMADVMEQHRPEVIIHLAAEAGVLASTNQPRIYHDANVVGTFELLEAARQHPPAHLLLASTSSAYGANTEMPYSETMKADWPVSIYAATKKATEVIAHAYSHLFGLPVTMFRFFTVYGPWGRPDMAYFLFTDAIMNDRPIKVFNHGDMQRDFVYVGDLIEAIRRLVDVLPPAPQQTRVSLPGDSLSPVAPYRVVNIGKSAPDSLMDFIAAIEAATGRTATKKFLEMPLGDVQATWADATLLERLTDYRPNTGLAEGLQAFVDWYCSYYGTEGPDLSVPSER